MVSIIIVEDSPQKAQAILGTLKALESDAPHSVEIFNNANDAKRRMRDKKFDLLILDLSLPLSADGLPLADGGIKLLEELRNRDNYLIPQEVIGLTAYPELIEGTASLFAQDLWSLVYYDPSSETWAMQIGRKVLHLSMAASSREPLVYKSFLCIVAALAEPELSALMRLPWNWRRHFSETDVTEYQSGSVNVKNEKQEVIAASCGRMGMASAAALASKMCEVFRPRYLGMVGLAAGIRDRTELGDIIVADPSWDWGSGKVTVKNGSTEFLIAPHQISLHSSMRVRFEMMSRNEERIEQIRREWPGPKPNSILSMKVGAVASGATVLASSKKVTEINRQHRKLLGIEMETYGIYSAAAEARLPQPLAFSIKSVCDFADEGKKDDYQGYAAYTSASALRIFVENYL